MKKLEEKEMMKVEGGINILVVTAITTAVVFISGVITGIVNPTRCNNG